MIKPCPSYERNKTCLAHTAMKEKVAPQKRNKNLIPLSREHHFGLLFCWKLRQGLKNRTELDVMRAYVLYFWKHILKPHCEEEEWLLDRLIPKYDVNRSRMEEEHRLIQALIDLISKGSPMNRELFKVLEKDLVDHIRWEERDLFPYLQSVVNPDKLDAVGDLLAHQHDPRTDTFMPEFWIVKGQKE